MTLKLLDLFSGIGGFSLGLERSGYFETIAFCEINPKPHRVLKAHWPGVPIYNDVREITAERLRADGIGVDAICGGFPCQDISHAGDVWGLGAGLDGGAADYGANNCGSFASYDRESHSWRTYQHCLGGAREEFSGAWPRSGMMRNGIAYLLDTLAYPTSATATGLWPTPAARDYRDLSRKQAFSSQLARKSPSLASRLLTLGRRWQEIPEIYAAVMAFPSGWHAKHLDSTETP